MTETKQAKAAAYVHTGVRLGITAGSFIGLAWITSYGLRHGVHVGTSYLGLSVLFFSIIGGIRLFIGNLAHEVGRSLHKGKSQAEREVHLAMIEEMSKLPGGSDLLASMLGGLSAKPAPASEPSAFHGNFL